jgi:hypothetical protein
VRGRSRSLNVERLVIKRSWLVSRYYYDSLQQELRKSVLRLRGLTKTTSFSRFRVSLRYWPIGRTLSAQQNITHRNAKYINALIYMQTCDPSIGPFWVTNLIVIKTFQVIQYSVRVKIRPSEVSRFDCSKLSKVSENMAVYILGWMCHDRGFGSLIWGRQ